MPVSFQLLPGNSIKQQYSLQNPCRENAHTSSHLKSLDFMEKWANGRCQFCTKPPACGADLQLYSQPSSHWTIWQRQRGSQASRFLDTLPISGLGNQADLFFARILSKPARFFGLHLILQSQVTLQPKGCFLQVPLFLLAIPPTVQLQPSDDLRRV